MKIDELQSLFVNNIQSLYKYNMSEFLTRKQGTVSLDFANRLLVFIQDRAAMDVKSEYKWLIYGRKLKDNAYGINIIVPKYKITYTDKDTGEPISSINLTPSEFNKAFKLGVIQKHKEVISYELDFLYDIRDTVIYDEGQYGKYINNLANKEIKISNILSFMEDALYINVVNGEKTEYTNGNVVIGSEDVQDKVSKLIGILSNILSNQSHILEVTGLEREFIGKAIEYSLKTYNKISVTNKDEIDKLSNEVYNQLSLNEEDTDKLIDIMNIIETYVNSVIDLSINHFETSVEKEFIINKKATRLLNILEANQVIKHMKGGNMNGIR